MCGVFGFLDRSKNIADRLEKARIARDTLTHRGPDQAGEWHDDHVYLSQRRLSIMDLSDAGRQPMAGYDETISIIANGEIYNFKILREALEREGAIFKSNSDSEVILHGYKYWGIDTLLEKMDGIYALSIYDKEKQKIFMARDRAGVKPLHYFLRDDVLCWASELKAIVSLIGRDQLQEDNTALYDFLTYSYIPAPKTMYKDVFKLPPACVAEYDITTGSLTKKRYWHLPVSNNNLPDRDNAETIRILLQKSVSEQMMSDVPVGFFLSGGIDSSVIATYAAKLVDQIKTFTIGFGVLGFDETPYAKIMALKLHTEHHVEVISPKQETSFAAWLEKIYDEPFGSTSSLPTYCVSALAQKHVTVTLSGDGGDELFGGYKWYQDDSREIMILRFLNMLPAFLWDLPLPRAKGIRTKLAALKGTNNDPLAIYNNLYFTKIFGEERQAYRKKLGIPNSYDDLWFYRPYYKPELGKKKWKQYLDFHAFMPEQVLTKVDRASMANSIEARVPFLSKELIEFAFTLPESFIYKNETLKGGLKYALANVLPAEILYRPKQGFSMPWHKWQKKIVGAGTSLQQNVIEHFYATKP